MTNTITVNENMVTVQFEGNTMAGTFEGATLKEVTALDVQGFDGATVTVAQANELLKAPITQEFKTGTPERAVIYDTVELLDFARCELFKLHHGKPNVYYKTYSNGRQEVKPIEVGTAGFYYSWTDSFPCIVTKVSPSGKQITVQDVEATPTADFNYYTNQDYTFRNTPIGNEQKAYKADWGYKNKSTRFRFGEFSKSVDVHF